MQRHLLLAASAALFLEGCLYTSHHFNSGRILAPGNTALTVGWGSFKLNDPVCDENAGWRLYIDDSEKAHCVRGGIGSDVPVGGDTVDAALSQIRIPKFSLGYRLGVREAWGPFTGVELGWHLEAPTNPGSAEFDLKFGLPAPGRYFHSLSGGWIIGMWADNSFFGEYAASRAFGSGDSAHALYVSYRFTHLATQPVEAFRTDTLVNRFGHNRRQAHQASAGLYWRLPAFPILPDFVTPQATVSTPWVPVFDGVRPEHPILLDFNLGFGWRF